MSNALLSEENVLDLLSVDDHQNEDVGTSGDLNERGSSLSSDGDELLEGRRVGVVSEAGDSSLDDRLGHSETLRRKGKSEKTRRWKVRNRLTGKSSNDEMKLELTIAERGQEETTETSQLLKTCLEKAGRKSNGAHLRVQ